MSDLQRDKEILLQLQKPFQKEQIRWRVQQAGMSKNNSPWVMVIPYVDNRAIQERLDEVFGLSWSNSFKPTPSGDGWLCGITAQVGDDQVTRWDGAEHTHIEKLKGGLSDAMKRAAVQFGIGRYLYQMEAIFAECHCVENRRDAENLHIIYPDKQKKSIKWMVSWATPDLPDWAQPFEDHSEFINKIENAQTIEDLKLEFKTACMAAQASKKDALLEQAIAAKDHRKAQILKHLQDQYNKKYSTTKEWLEREISIFSSLPSEATIENNARLIYESLHQKCLDLEINREDRATLNELLNRAKKNRINQINQTN